MEYSSIYYNSALGGEEVNIGHKPNPSITPPFKAERAILVSQRALAPNLTDMPYTKIMIHAVWGTKSRTPALTHDIRRVIIAHIKDNAQAKGIYIDRINGYTEHLHCLFSLNADMSVSKAMQLIKGESAFWLNKQNLIPTKFEWADEYFASSVSESVLSRVRTYIDRQEEHHRKVTFAEEFQEFISIHGMPGSNSAF